MVCNLFIISLFDHFFCPIICGAVRLCHETAAERERAQSVRSDSVCWPPMVFLVLVIMSPVNLSVVSTLC